MQQDDNSSHLPNANQLSVLVAVILLAYAVTPFIQIPDQGFTLPLPGVVFDFKLDFSTIVSFVVAALAASGMDWLLKSRPEVEGRQALQHLILPALMAWLIGFPLRTLEVGPQWWAVFTLGGLLLIIVFIAEYVVVDFSDRFYALATSALVAVSFAAFLFLSIAVRAAGFRLYVVLPVLFLSIALVSLRTLYLRLDRRWRFTWAILVGLVVGQFAVGFHYLPLAPLNYGLLLLGPAYVLISFANQYEEKQYQQWFWLEPAVMFLLLWILGLTIRS